MKKLSWLALLLLGFYKSSQAQGDTTHLPGDTITQRIVLIGDAGQLTDGKHPVVDAVRKMIPLDKKTTVLFLGDNLYEFGLPDNESALFNAAKAVLDSQLSVADGTPSQVYMIPGNHDWKNGARDGYATILRQQLYVDFLGKDNVHYEPKDGCPGPVEVNLGNDVTLVLFDSQWWLHTYDKPEIESDCPYKTKEEFLTQLEDIVSRNSKKLLIIACHHTFKSNSVHGGFFTWKQHLFPFTDIMRGLYIPLPVLGSIYPIARSVFGTPQDLRHPNYANMINDITNAVKSAPNVVFVAGHDHGLQLIKDSSRNYITSGAGSKINRVSIGKKSMFAAGMTGFAVMEVSKNKNVTVSFYTVTDSIRNPFNGTIMNFSKIPDEKLDSTTRVVDIPNVKYRDTITISASEKYPPLKGLRRVILGQNYRPEWSTPVNMRVFNINSEKGGFKIMSLGGGKQTRSLRLKDSKGKEWVLRSVEKNPTGALPENFRNTFAQDVVQEFTSAANPYAPLTIPPLAKALDIAVPHPELFFVPDDRAFGFYQPMFANSVCMLEERDPSKDGSDTKSTAKVFDKLTEENDHRADQFAALRARLLDILIGDFDRHFDQWKWATSDTGKGKLYYPIPRDRDQAFFYSDGLLLKMVSRHLMPFLAGFHYNIRKVEWLGYPAKDFDRLFLTDLDADEWKKTISEFQQDLTDSVIREAVKKLPPEIYAINGETITKKLISRRDLMEKAGMKYYRFISRQVNIVGSNQKEYFKVLPTEDGLEVKVYAREKGNDTSFVMYDRKFRFHDTYEIRLYGLNDDDLFDIDDKVDSKIKIRIIGGKGNDTFDIHGNVRNLLYDINAEGNYIKHTSRTKNRFSQDPPVNSYNILGFQYNKSRFPQIEVGFNSDDGFVVGAGFYRITHGFRNEPYATSQKFLALYSFNKAYRFSYDAEFNHVTRNTDIVLHGEFKYPSLDNFFGLGNSTIKDPNTSYGFYRTRYKTIELQALFRHRYFEKLQVSFGPYFLRYWNHYNDNVNRILGKPAQIGLDSADIYTSKTYAGGKLDVRVDNRNNQLFPTRGVLWNNELVMMKGIGKTANDVMKVTSDMTVYASLNDPAKVVAVLGLGGGRIFNKNFDYFQAMTLGAGNNNLHGFRKNRYAGQSSLYGSLEIRWKLFNVNSYIVPGPLGLIGFYDIGRVKMPKMPSSKWHNAYGGGFYFIPYNLFMVTFTAGFTPKEKLFNFTLGSKIDLTF